MACSRRPCCGVNGAVLKVGLIVGLGLFIALSGLASYAVFPTVLKSQVEANLVLEPGNEVFSSWEQVPIPIYVSYYLFNVTNPEGILEGSEKPRLQEVGPFTFRETRHKVNVSWHEDGTVSYRQVKRYYFQPDKTHGSFDDVIVALNVPMVSAVYTSRYHEFFRFAISSLIQDSKSSLFVKRQVRELLFEGYEDSLIDAALDMDMDVPADKFGWMYGKNGSDDGQYSIFSGLKGMQDYGYVDKFNGMSNMTAYHGHCNTISGTTGEMWPPEMLESADNVELFIADFCRSIRLRYLTDVVSHRVKLRRYWADNQLFNSTVPENRCFCSDLCFPSGVLNVSACQHGVLLCRSALCRVLPALFVRGPFLRGCRRRAEARPREASLSHGHRT